MVSGFMGGPKLWLNCLLFGFCQVRVDISYCSLNLIDVQYMEQKNDDVLLPMIPGSEFSGEVLEIGDNCKQNFKPGDKIASLLGRNHFNISFAVRLFYSSL